MNNFASFKRFPLVLLVILLGMSGCAEDRTSAQSTKIENNVTESGCVETSPLPETPVTSPDDIQSSMPDGSRICASLSDWAQFCDEAGELIDFESDDVKSLNMRYVVGWTLNDPKPRKIYQGDIVCGFQVSWTESQYYIAYSTWGTPPHIFASYMSYSFNMQDITLRGLVRRQSDMFGNVSTKFYPYPDNDFDFPIILPYSQDTYDFLKELSSVYIGGDTVIEVQPIGIRIDNIPATGDVFDVTIKFDELIIGTLSQGEAASPHDLYAIGSEQYEIMNIELLR